MNLRTIFRPLAAACAVLLVGFGVVVGATPALAHHNTIVGSVACGDAPSTWVITWAVANSEQDKVEKITDSNRPQAIAVGTQFGAGETYVGKETVKQPVEVTLRVAAQWDNGATNTSQGSVSKDQFPTGCWDGGADSPITFCHEGALQTSTQQLFYRDGHLNHAHDIYPAGEFTLNGSTTRWDAHGDQSLLGTKCASPSSDECAEIPGDQPKGFPCTMEPIDRRVPGSVEGCEVGGVQTWVDVYTTTYTFVDGEWVANPETGPVRINEEFTAYTPQQLVDLGCATVLTNPSVTAIDECGTLHDRVTLSTGAHYTGVDKGAGLATFTAAKGYVFESHDLAGRNRYVTTLVLRYQVPSATLCPVTPVGIKVAPPTCDHGGKLTIPAQPIGVRVFPSAGTYGPGSYHVRFAALEGYELTKDRSRRVRIGKAIFAHCPAASAEASGPHAGVRDSAAHAALPNTGASVGNTVVAVAGLTLLLGGVGIILLGRRRLS